MSARDWLIWSAGVIAYAVIVSSGVAIMSGHARAWLASLARYILKSAAAIGWLYR